MPQDIIVVSLSLILESLAFPVGVSNVWLLPC